MAAADDHAYLIVGELNKLRWHIEVKENNKNVTHRPIIYNVLSDDKEYAGKKNANTLMCV